jgi:hypothetical protein
MLYISQGRGFAAALLLKNLPRLVTFFPYPKYNTREKS